MDSQARFEPFSNDFHAHTQTCRRSIRKNPVYGHLYRVSPDITAPTTTRPAATTRRRPTATPQPSSLAALPPAPPFQVAITSSGQPAPTLLLLLLSPKPPSYIGPTWSSTQPWNHRPIQSRLIFTTNNKMIQPVRPLFVHPRRATSIPSAWFLQPNPILSNTFSPRNSWTRGQRSPLHERPEFGLRPS